MSKETPIRPGSGNICAACEHKLYEYYTYCPDCGQKIDWKSDYKFKHSWIESFDTSGEILEALEELHDIEILMIDTNNQLILLRENGVISFILKYIYIDDKVHTQIEEWL